jgi:hypothetical protein
VLQFRDEVCGLAFELELSDDDDRPKKKGKKAAAAEVSEAGAVCMRCAGCNDCAQTAVGSRFCSTSPWLIPCKLHSLLFVEGHEEQQGGQQGKRPLFAHITVVKGEGY